MTREELGKQYDALRLLEYGSKGYLEKARNVLHEAVTIGDENCQANTLYCIGVQLFYNGSCSEAIQTLNQSQDLSLRIGLWKNYGNSLIAKGNVHRAEGLIKEAKQDYDEAMLIANTHGDLQQIAEAHLNLARWYMDSRLFELAQEHVQQAYVGFCGTELEWRALYELARIHFAAENYHEAIEVFQQVIKVLANGIDPNSHFVSHQAFENIGECYFEVGDYDLSIQNFEASLKFYDKQEKVLIWMARTEMARGNIDRAEDLLKECLAIESIQEKPPLYADYLTLFALLELLRNAPERAIIYLDRTASLQQMTDHPILDDTYYKIYAEALEKSGEFAKAIEYYKRSKELAKQRTAASFRAKLNAFQIHLATEREQKEKEIEKMKREQLERELSNTTLQLLAQTEVLSNLRTDLLGMARRIPPTDPVAKELCERIRNLPCKSIDWEKFDTQFKAAHPEFMRKLLEKYPNLSATESRICSLIRMNLKSEEIARLFCLSERTIENHRYNIRKKMKIGNGQDMVKMLSVL